MPVLVAVGGVAVLAEACVVVEPGGVDLGEGQGRPERLGDLLRPAGFYGVATVSVLHSDAFEDEMPSVWLAVQQEEVLPLAVPLLPSRRGALPVPRVRYEWKAIHMPHMAGLPPFPSPWDYGKTPAGGLAVVCQIFPGRAVEFVGAQFPRSASALAAQPGWRGQAMPSGQRQRR